MKLEFHPLALQQHEAEAVITFLMTLYPSIGAEEVSVPAASERSPDPTPLEEAIAEAVKGAIEETGDAILDTSLLPSNLDANGHPWDERIHASSKAKNADGSWRAKRGVASELVAEVEAELAEVEAAKGYSQDLEDEIDPAGRIAAAIETAPSPPVPPAPPTPPAPPAPGAPTFAQVMQKITGNKIEPARVKELLSQVNASSIAELMKADRADDLAGLNALVDLELGA